jgi:Ca-activated chloride channel family protein
MLKVLGILYTITVIISANPASAETVRGKMKRGVSHYKQQEYDQALKDFIDAQIEAPDDARLSYNIGNAYYKMKNYEEAIKSFLNSAARTEDIKLEEKSYYNLGNAFYRQGKLQEAIAYYQKALELEPDDLDAKKNLEFVREKIKRHINQEKERRKRQSSQTRQEQENQEHGQDQQQQQSQHAQSNQHKRQAQQSQQARKDGGGQPQVTGTEGKQDQEKEQARVNSAPVARQMSDEEAQRWLDSLSEDRRKFMKQQMKALSGRRYTSGKDW